MNSVERFWRAAGFSVCCTGGTCLAFERTVGGLQLLVTAANEAELPRTLDEPVWVGRYDAETGEMLDAGNFAPEFKDSLAALAYIRRLDGAH